MKKIIKLTILSSIYASSLFATSVTDKIIEAKRIQKIDAIVDKETQLYKKIVKYVKETGDLTPTRKEIQMRYDLVIDDFTNYQGDACSNSSGYCNDNTSSGITINFDTTNNQIILGNILGSFNSLSSTELNRFQSSPQKEAFAETLTNNYSRKFIISDNKELGFTVNLVNSAKANNKVILQMEEPSATNRNKMWIKPFGDGTFDAMMWNSTISKWQNRGKIDNRNTLGSGENISELTFYLSEGFSPQTTIGQKGWVANVESKYGFTQYKHNGTEWVQITVADNQVYKFSDISDLITSHMEDPIGSVISGVVIPNSSVTVEFTKYSKYWATKDGMFFVIEDKANLPNTVKNGAKAWIKNGNLILSYESLINSWVVLFVDLEDWKNKRNYLINLDYIKILSDGKRYRYYLNAGEMIVSSDGMVAYIIGSDYAIYSPSSLGLKENAMIYDYMYGTFNATVRYAPYKNPIGQNMLLFYGEPSHFWGWTSWKNYNDNMYIVLNDGTDMYWAKDGYWTNHKSSTQKKYITRYNYGTRTGNTIAIPNLPYAQLGQKLYADRDGDVVYYYELVEYTGQSNGTWKTSYSGNPAVNYIINSIEEAYPANLPFQNGNTAFFLGNTQYYYTWVDSRKVWSRVGTALQVMKVKYNNQYQDANINLDYIGVTSDGSVYYTKAYPADTYVNAQMLCTRDTKEADTLPPLSLTTAGDGEIASDNADYYWTTDSDVAGTRIVFNGKKTKVASENTAYPFKCIRKYEGQIYK